MGKEKKKKLGIYKNYQITHHAFCDFSGLLKALAQWFGDMQYFYQEKGISEKDIGTGYEVESNWIAERKINPYVKFEIQVNVHARDLRELVLADGRHMQSCRLIIRVSSDVIKNYDKTFGDSGFQEWLRQFYERYVVDDELAGYEGKLYIESTAMINTLKQYLS